MGRPPIDITKLVALAQGAARALNPPDRQANDAIMRRVTRGGTTVRVEATTGIVPANRSELGANLSLEQGEQTAQNAWAGGAVTADAIFNNVSLQGLNPAGDQVWRLAPSGQLDVNTIFLTDGQIQMRENGPVNIFLTPSGYSRFAIAPQVGPDGSSKRVLTTDDLGPGTGGITVENVDDRIASLLVAGAGVTLTYNDAANTLTIASTGGGSAVRVEGRTAANVFNGFTLDAAAIIDFREGMVAQSGGTGKVNVLVDIGTGATQVAAGNHSHTSFAISDFAERAQDAVAAMLAAGTGVTLAYNDTANTLTITGTTGSGGLDAEAVRDAIGVALLGVGNITVTVNDAADTITISTLATANSSDAALRDRGTHTGSQLAATVSDLTETVDDRVAALIVAGSGITKTYDDVANTLTIAATGGGTGAGTRDYPITYVSLAQPTTPRLGDFWLDQSGRPASDDPHANLVVSATQPASPTLGLLWATP